jgi:hypothetical protein
MLKINFAIVSIFWGGGGVDDCVLWLSERAKSTIILTIAVHTMKIENSEVEKGFGLI